VPKGCYERSLVTKLHVWHFNSSRRGKVSPFKGKRHSDSAKQKLSEASLGQVVSIETRKKIGDVHRGKARPQFIKDKIRQGCRRYYITHGQLSIGHNEKMLLDAREIIDNCSIERSFFIPQLGFIVDGYCTESNTVYEVYEPFHHKTKQIAYDENRQRKIQDFLKCRFIVIWDLKTSKRGMLLNNTLNMEVSIDHRCV